MAILTQRVTWKRERKPAVRPDISGRLTPAEQDNVRTALKAMRLHYGTWEEAAEHVTLTHRTLRALVNGRPPQASHALSIARVIGVPVEAVLGGKLDVEAMLRKMRRGGGACPTCGRRG